MIGRMLLTLRLGIRNLLGYPLRTLLTTLGIIFGVGAVIAMMAISAGAEKALLEEIGRLGIRNIILNTVKPPVKTEDTQTNAFQFNRYGLTYKDKRMIEESIPGLSDVLPVHTRRRTVWNGSQKVEATVYAVQPRHMRLFGLTVVRGRALTQLDGERMKRVCVIRSGLLRQLGIFEEPVGRHLLVGEHYYRIVGVLEEREFLGYAQKALAIDAKTSEIYMPYGTVSRRLGTRTVIQRQGSREATDVELSQLVVAVKDLDNAIVVSRMLRRVLDRNHDDKDYEIVVPIEELAQRRNTQKIFNIVLISIASISLLVGGIGIANIMLATVTERTREIGIRRALGAKRRDITAQFLAETTLISTLGGLLGVGFGFLLIAMLTRLAGYEAIVSPSVIVLALGIAMGVGIIFGIFPARRAAQLDPIAALRHE